MRMGGEAVRFVIALLLSSSCASFEAYRGRMWREDGPCLQLCVERFDPSSLALRSEDAGGEYCQCWSPPDPVTHRSRWLRFYLPKGMEGFKWSAR